VVTRPYLAQELVLTARRVCYRRERGLTPNGVTTVPPRPSALLAIFGPEMRPFVLTQHPPGPEPAPAEAGVTFECLVALL
jgi:hypothetical protein